MRRSARASARSCLLAALCCAALGESRAAGGHFGVDDAAVLDPGQCQIETWVEREPGARTLVHVGPACRVGAVELGLNGDHLRTSGERVATVVGPQVKWVHAIDERTSIGVVALAGWRTRPARYATAGLYVPVTVQLADGLWLHANGGRDWFAEAPAATRAGVALEWQAAPAWSLTGEAFRQARINVARVGARWQASESFSIDLSGARGARAALGSFWALGANWTFAP